MRHAIWILPVIAFLSYVAAIVLMAVADNHFEEAAAMVSAAPVVRYISGVAIATVAYVALSWIFTRRVSKQALCSPITPRSVCLLVFSGFIFLILFSVDLFMVIGTHSGPLNEMYKEFGLIQGILSGLVGYFLAYMALPRAGDSADVARVSRADPPSTRFGAHQ